MIVHQIKRSVIFYKRFRYVMLVCMALWACKTEIKRLEFDTQIEAKVVNDSNQPIQGVTVGLYTDFEMYKKDIARLTTLNAIKNSQTDATGTVNFPNLQDNISYWLAIYFFDSLRYPGVKILYNNKNINNSLAVKPRKGSINYVTLKLEAFEGLLSFTASTSDSSRLPIQIVVNNSVAGNVLRTKTGPASVFNDPAALTTPVSKGVFTYYAKSGDCSWTGKGTIAGADWLPIHLDPCNNGSIVFWSSDTLADIYPIRITLNDVDILPNITGPQNTAPPCNTSRKPGTYNYLAETANKKCSWIGTIQISPNKCTAIQLPKCP